MSDEARNVAILKQAYSRWSETKGGSVSDWMDICADNIGFGSLAQGRPVEASYMTAYNNRDALKGYFDGLARDWEMVDWDTKSFVAQGDRVVALVHCVWRNKNTGKTVSTPKADSWRFADGKAVEYYEYFDTAQVHAAAVS
jgi:ketosteroid isomerase-like protein